MSDPLLIDVTTHESSGTYFAVLQRWIKQACINAGITFTMGSPTLLRDLTTYDSEGTRFAVLQQWLKLLANNITGGGGAAIQKGTVPLVAGTQSYAIVFTTPFATPPGQFGAIVMMPGSSGEAFFATPDYSTLTTTGVTVWLDGVPTAASNGGVINWSASQ